VTEFVRTLRRADRLLGGQQRGRWVLLVVLALIVTAFEALGAVLIYALLTTVTGDVGNLRVPGLGQLGHLFPQTDAQTLQVLTAAAVAGFFLLRSVVVVGQYYIQARIVQNAGARLANHLVRGYLALPYLTHTQLNSAELVRNAFDSVQNLVTGVLKPAVEVMAELVLVIGLAVLLLVVAPQTTLIAAVVMLPAVWVLQAIVQPKLKRLGRCSQDARQETLRAMQQALSAVRDVRLLGREASFSRSFATQRWRMARAEYLRTALSEIPRTLIETVLVVVVVVILLVAVLYGDNIEGLLSTLGIFAYAALRLQPSLRKMVQGLNHVRFGSAIVEDLSTDRIRVDAVLNAPRVQTAGEGTTFEHAVEFRGVIFRYSEDAPPALRGIDLTIRCGEFVGVCGPTGGGKSTLIDLFVGLLQPSEGQIVIDGSLLGAHPAWWYAQIGVVSQHLALLDESLRRNIAFGLDDDEVDEVALADAIRRAQLTDVVSGLPNGLNTVLGERGVRLSGGQRQRVAIARALYRRPSVIILDEGTSALDSATELALMEAIEELKVGRTVVSVAHRISTVRHADRIVVVADGRIAGKGTYQELVRDNELFRKLAT
jgi:ATP-binding cassette, subfamily B, bacterial PglK